MTRPKCFGDYPIRSGGSPVDYAERDCRRCSYEAPCMIADRPSRHIEQPRPCVMVRAVSAVLKMSDPHMSYRWSGAWRHPI